VGNAEIYCGGCSSRKLKMRGKKKGNAVKTLGGCSSRKKTIQQQDLGDALVKIS